MRHTSFGRTTDGSKDSSISEDRLVVEPQTYTLILFINKEIESMGQGDTKLLQSVEEEKF